LETGADRPQVYTDSDFVDVIRRLLHYGQSNVQKASNEQPTGRRLGPRTPLPLNRVNLPQRPLQGSCPALSFEAAGRAH
jgi:hypothetical protein